VTLLEGLGINLPQLISQLVSFIILFGALSLVAYKPILKMLRERSEKIKESLEQAESIKEESSRAEEEIKKQIQEASQRGQDIIARATQTSDEIRSKAQELAKKDAEALISRALQEIKSERDGAIDELRREFAELTIKAAGKVIGQSLDAESHRQLIDKVLEESKTLNKG
jgi:F-type H+-transporting ATPase subunit b